MKGFLWSLIMATLLFAIPAFAQTTIDGWDGILAFIGEFKNLTTLGKVIGITQVLLFVINKSILDKVLGVWKLVAVSFLTLVVTAVTFKMQAPDTSWMAILTNGAVFASIQVFINQVIKQIGKKD